MKKEKLIKRYENVIVIKLEQTGSITIRRPVIEVWHCTEPYYQKPQARAYAVYEDGSEQAIPTYNPSYDNGKLEDDGFWRPSHTAVTFFFHDISEEEARKAVAKEFNRRAQNGRSKVAELLKRAEEYETIARSVLSKE